MLTTGTRVLKHDGETVLAVDERLRYGPLKAGYHGGTCPAEVVVPLVVLTPGNLASDLQPAPSQKPPWWEFNTQGPTGPVSEPITWHTPDDSKLFDLHEPAGGDAPATLGSAVVGSDTYATQRSISRRVSLTDAQVQAAVDALAAAAGTRLPRRTWAMCSACPPFACAAR